MVVAIPTPEALPQDASALEIARHGLARAYHALEESPVTSEDLRESRSGISEALSGWRRLHEEQGQ